MSEELKVDTGQLVARAGELEGLAWPGEPIKVVAPDSLLSTGPAIENINANAEALQRCNKWAEAEAKRVADILRKAATEYDKKDAEYAGVLTDDPARMAAMADIAVAPPPDPRPPNPEPMAPLSGASPIGECMNVKGAQEKLVSGGDGGQSARSAYSQWNTTAANLSRILPDGTILNWEGAAAETAETYRQELIAWMQQVSAAWKAVANNANIIDTQHRAAVDQHTPIYQRYLELEAELKDAATVNPWEVREVFDVVTGNEERVKRILESMQELERRSEDVRSTYASAMNLTPAQPPGPPRGAGGIEAGQVPGTPPSSGPLGSIGSNGTGAQPGTSGIPSVDPASVAPPTSTDPSEGKQSGGSPSGGGAPSGGGSSSGGAPSGGLPSGLPKGTDGTPDIPGLGEPGLKPASAGGGGGLGGGGGMPGGPLGPAVGADSVGASPTGARGGGAAGAPGNAGMGGMGGGMGGMGGGHGQGSQGKEKRRNPGLSPDEDIYIEDRQYTEGIIGRRKRKPGQDGQEPK